MGLGLWLGLWAAVVVRIAAGVVVWNVVGVIGIGVELGLWAAVVVMAGVVSRASGWRFWVRGSGRRWCYQWDWGLGCWLWAVSCGL